MPPNKFTKEKSERARELGRKGGMKGKGRISPTTQAKVDAREELRKLIEADMRELHSAWKDAALGHFMQVKMPTGEMKVYKKAPNAVAIKDMFERAFGKPEQPITGDVTMKMELSTRAQSILNEINSLDYDESGQSDSKVDDDDSAGG